MTNASLPRTASIVAVGSELLGVHRLDTNSLFLASVLERFGVELRTKSVVGDDVEGLATELRRRLDGHDLVLVTGGLGPTTDDATRAAAASATGRSLREDAAVVAHIRALYARFGREMPAVNLRQAEVLEGATVLRNDWGTAPGQRLEVEGAAGPSTLFLFPGVPREMQPMVAMHLEPWLVERAGGDPEDPASLADLERAEQRLLKVACMAESSLEERIAPVYEEFGKDERGNDRIAVLARPGDISVYYRAVGRDAERAAILDPLGEALRRHIGRAVYGDREGEGLEHAVARLLTDAGQTLVTAESCTGGMIAARLTDVAGSSAFFLGSGVTYSNQLKQDLLGVPEELLIAHGAVSEEVARAMASGARTRFAADLAIAVTGIAGPGGGTDEKPVGLVHLALAGPGDDEVAHRRVQFPGDRERVRIMTAQTALDMVRRRLEADR